MIKLIFSTLYFFSILGAFAKLHADKIEVAGYQFSPPEKWVSTPPLQRCGRHSLPYSEKTKKTQKLAFFHFGAGGAGGVKANVDRWMSQFEDAQDQVVKNTVIGDIPVTYVQANGTFLSGRAFGLKLLSQTLLYWQQL